MDNLKYTEGQPSGLNKDKFDYNITNNYDYNSKLETRPEIRSEDDRNALIDSNAKKMNMAPMEYIAAKNYGRVTDVLPKYTSSYSNEYEVLALPVSLLNPYLNLNFNPIPEPNPNELGGISRLYGGSITSDKTDKRKRT